MNIYLVIFLTLIAALISSFSQLLFKKGIKKRLDSVYEILGLLLNKTVLIGLCGYLASFLIYLYVLSTSQLSIVFPIFASSFIFVTIISAVTLKEKVTLIRVVGVLLIFFGITMVALTV
ncbi:MAG: EamA family transporter [Candidatus Micrarchaeaceae archaeon]|jgi:drug/metabolite transporter (DMT)-like permease